MANGREILTTAVEGYLEWAYASEIKRDDDGWITSVVLSPSHEEYEFDPVRVTCGQLKAAERVVLERMPNTRSAEYIRNDNHDAESADVCLQIAALSEVTFG